MATKSKLLNAKGEEIEVGLAEDLPPSKSAVVAQMPDGRMSMLKVLAQAAADEKCQPEKMRVLLDMHKEIEADVSRHAFFRDFGKMQDELPIINKDGYIENEGKAGAKTAAGRKGHVQRFATFENLFTVVKPIARRHGFTIWFEPGIGANDGLTVRTHLVHAEGHEISCILPLLLETSGAKNNVQGTGSSVSYGKRYGLIAVCAIISMALTDRDTDGNKPKVEEAGPAEDKPITKGQLQTLEKRIAQCGVSREKALAKFGVEDFAQLPASRYADVLAACAAYETERRNREAGPANG